MHLIARLTIATTCSVLASSATASSFAAQAGATRPSEVSITPMVGTSGYGLEAGAKVDYLLANPGFIAHINNSVFVEGHAFVATDGGPFVAPQVRWDFHLHPQWTLYGAGGIEANLGARHNHDASANILFTAGATWRIPAKSFTIRGEVDLAHGALRLGPSFPL